MRFACINAASSNTEKKYLVGTNTISSSSSLY